MVDELVGLVKQKKLTLWLERHAFSDFPHGMHPRTHPQLPHMDFAMQLLIIIAYII